MKTSEDPAKKTVPPQHAGIKTNVEFTVSLPSAEETSRRYTLAKERLLSVNEWHKLCGLLSANFTLTDSEGNVVHEPATAGHHIRIDLPGPGNDIGQGYDWVEIEKIEDRTTRSGKAAYIAMRVRPSSHPQKLPGHIAHFFRNDATSSFVIERTGNRLKASVYGRNEQPNTEADNWWDKVRNTLVAVSAILGMSRPQWKSLVKGFLK